jgi:hypothetical protein
MREVSSLSLDAPMYQSRFNEPSSNSSGDGMGRNNRYNRYSPKGSAMNFVESFGLGAIGAEALAQQFHEPNMFRSRQIMDQTDEFQTRQDQRRHDNDWVMKKFDDSGNNVRALAHVFSS